MPTERLYYAMGKLNGHPVAGVYLAASSDDARCQMRRELRGPRKRGRPRKGEHVPAVEIESAKRFTMTEEEMLGG